MTAADRYDPPRQPVPWWDLTPESPEVAEQRRDAMNEGSLDDERWIKRRREIEEQARLQQQQHP